MQCCEKQSHSVRIVFKKTNKQTNKLRVCAYTLPCLYLVVLVRGDRDEGSFWEHVRAERRVFGAEAVIFIRLHNVDPRLVFMHRVQNNL